MGLAVNGLDPLLIHLIEIILIGQQKYTFEGLTRQNFELITSRFIIIYSYFMVNKTLRKLDECKYNGK